MAERRKLMRLDVPLNIRYEILGGAPVKIKFRLSDITREGLRIYGKNPLPKGSYVELEIKLPRHKKPLIAFGRVLWTKKKGASSYDTGIRFTKIKKSNRAELLGYAYDEWKKKI